MTEAGEIVHGTNRMRFENSRILDREGWITINTKMKEALRLVEGKQQSSIGKSIGKSEVGEE